MAFQIINDIQVPASTITRSRPRGELAQTVDSLQVGQGFFFPSDKPLKTQYPKVSPSRFPSETEGMSKKFKLWIESEGVVGVKRLADVATAEAAADEAAAVADGTADAASDDENDGE